MAHDVFISYSSKDKAVADAVCAKLEAAGIRCWIAPRDIPAGSNYPREIVRAIETSRAVVLVFSGNSNRSKWVMSEIERAAHNNVVIIPFRVEDVQPGPDIEILIALQHWLDAITPPLERHLQELIRVVSGILGQTPPVVVDLPLTPAQARRGGRKGFEVDGKAYRVAFGPGLVDGQEVGLTRAEALHGTEKTTSRSGQFVTISVTPQDPPPAAGVVIASPPGGQVTLVFHVTAPMPVKWRRILGLAIAAVLLTILSVWGYHTALNGELWDAAGNGPPEEVERALARGADVNMTDGLGRTPLMMAAYNGYEDNVTVLVAHHADINARGLSRETALLNASFYARYNPQDPNSNAQSYTHIINFLLDHGADVNAANTKKQTPLLLNIALSGGDPALLGRLIGAGADVNAADDQGFTPLILASKLNYYLTIPELLKRGAKTDSQDSEGRTALMYAALHGYDRVVSALLNDHADPNRQAKKLGTALCFACVCPDINSPGARREYESTVSQLIAAGADVNIPDKNGNTPLSLARQYLGVDNPYDPIIQTLIRAGAKSRPPVGGSRTAADRRLPTPGVARPGPGEWRY